MSPAFTILIVEDDAEIVEIITSRLTREGFKVASATNGREGLKKAQEILPNLVLLDLRMPDLGGLDVCRAMKQDPKTKSIPIIMVTANNDEVDIVLGLEMGADDYVTKPFSLRELTARVHAVLRRGQLSGGEAVQSGQQIKIGRLTVNHARREVWLDQTPLKLTPTEFMLLWTLASNPGKVLTRNELIEKISSEEANLLERNIDVHVMSLRKKLGDEGNVIITVRGVGYKIRVDSASGMSSAA